MTREQLAQAFNSIQGIKKIDDILGNERNNFNVIISDGTLFVFDCDEFGFINSELDENGLVSCHNQKDGNYVFVPVENIIYLSID